MTSEAMKKLQEESGIKVDVSLFNNEDSKQESNAEKNEDFQDFEDSMTVGQAM
jgi:hypothetical protein